MKRLVEKVDGEISTTGEVGRKEDQSRGSKERDNEKTEVKIN